MRKYIPLTFLIIVYSCDAMREVQCPSGPVFVPKRPQSNYPEYVKVGQAKVDFFLKLTNKIDTAGLNIDTKKSIIMLRDTLSGWQTLLSRNLLEVKKLSDQRPCDEGLKNDYVQMCKDCQKNIFDKLSPGLEEKLKQFSNSSKFAGANETELVNLINQVIGK